MKYGKSKVLICEIMGFVSVELLMEQGQHVFTLHVLLHVGYTFIVS